jgi:hypothetical protein
MNRVGTGIGVQTSDGFCSLEKQRWRRMLRENEGGEDESLGWASHEVSNKVDA